MRIALLSPFEESVPPQKYGGTELVVFNLAEELVELGHDVVVFAPGDSNTSARLEAIFEVNLRKHPDATTPQLREALKLVGIGRVVERLRAGDFDVVHNHIGWRLLPFAGTIDAPIVTTLHGPMNVPYHNFMYSQFPAASFVSISDAQRRPRPDLNYVATVYNGISCANFDLGTSPDGYFAFLGRFSPEKGALEAIHAARAAGVSLVMAAKVDMADREYFDSAIQPLIDGSQIRYIGEVDHAGKNQLLGNARGLLAPIQWEEPFGLVFIEALACGTPVIANGRGSVPEIVRGDVGFVTCDHDSIVAAIRSIGTIDRRRCREYACTHFDRSLMARRYQAVYEKLVGNRQLQLEKCSDVCA